MKPRTHARTHTHTHTHKRRRGRQRCSQTAPNDETREHLCTPSSTLLTELASYCCHSRSCSQQSHSFCNKNSTGTGTKTHTHTHTHTRSSCSHPHPMAQVGGWWGRWDQCKRAYKAHTHTPAVEECTQWCRTGCRLTPPALRTTQDNTLVEGQ